MRLREMVPSEVCIQQLPSSSHARSGSIPRTSTNVGSDHFPDGSSAVTKKLRSPPSCVQTVVTNQNRPSRYRNVGANTPKDVAPCVERRSNCSRRSNTLPICCQSTRFVDRKIGTLGKYV